MAVRKRIGDLMIEAGLLTQEQLQAALKEQKEANMRLGDLLIARHYITEQQLVEVLEFQLGIPHVQLSKQRIDQKIINLVPQKIAEKYLVLPIRTEGNKLVVAMADPLDYFAIDELRMSTGFRIEPTIASKDDIVRAVKRYYVMQESVEKLMDKMQVKDVDESQLADDDSPIVQMVNQIITQAVHLGASDIHIDPQEQNVKIRYRVDGVLRTERTLPGYMNSVVSARVKVMAKLNLAERRLPQDGRIELDIDFRKIDLRVSTLPMVGGEKIVMRILDVSNSIKELDQIGFSDHNLSLFQKAIVQPYGMALITGPTGSGKSTTLYSALARLNRDEVNIITVEDPVEYQIEGINQMQVNAQIGLTFAKGLRSILRQDPNIVMVGEIRDTETAEIAVRAALTGHLVMSTLHTNSAVNSITRLIDMGVEPFLVSSSLNCIVAQRLIRKICPNCAVKYEPTVEEKTILAQYGLEAQFLRKARGCNECNRTGYKGRLPIHEVLVFDDQLRTMIMQRRPDSEYRVYAEEHGLIPIVVDALIKAVKGQTTLTEVFRVTTNGG